MMTSLGQQLKGEVDIEPSHQAERSEVERTSVAPLLEHGYRNGGWVTVVGLTNQHKSSSDSAGT